MKKKIINEILIFFNYYIMVVGNHILIDVSDIEEIILLEYVDNLKLLAIEIIEKLNINFVKIINYHFEPIGGTVLALLKESHLSLHSYPEKKVLSIDLYTCNLSTDFDLLYDIVNDFFDKKCKKEKIILNR